MKPRYLRVLRASEYQAGLREAADRRFFVERARAMAEGAEYTHSAKYLALTFAHLRATFVLERRFASMRAHSETPSEPIARRKEP